MGAGSYTNKDMIDNPRINKKGNPPESTRLYRVFVSSTSLDNRERRRIIQEAIPAAGMVWHGMEIFPACTRPTAEECLRLVREADLLIGIVAWRYGWEPDGEKSITEMEYEAARERLIFQLDPRLPVNPDTDFDQEPERWKKQEKLEAFKLRFSRDQMPAYFSETTLGAKVLHALNNWREQKEQQPVKKARSQKASPASSADSERDEEILSCCKVGVFSSSWMGWMRSLTFPVVNK